MRNIFSIGIALLAVTMLGGCTSSLYSGYNNDDLYATHDREAIAKKEAEIRQALAEEAKARKEQYEAMVAAAKQKYDDGYEEEELNFSSVLADTYESAYARRLRGFESPSYNMPSSYYNLRYSGAYTFLTAYDPAFYNIIVMGDQAWVEPKYITSMFGGWGTSLNFSFGWRNPWSYYYSPWYNPSSWYWRHYWWDPWYDSWYGMNWGFGWRPYYDWWWPHYGPNHGPAHGPVHKPSYGGGGSGRPGVIYRSPYRTAGTIGGTTNHRGQGSAVGGGSYRTRNSSGVSSSSSRSSNDKGTSSRYRSNSSSSSSRSSYSSGSSRSSGSSYSSGGGYSGGGGRSSSSGGSYGGGGSSSRGR